MLSWPLEKCKSPAFPSRHRACSLSSRMRISVICWSSLVLLPVSDSVKNRLLTRQHPAMERRGGWYRLPGRTEPLHAHPWHLLGNRGGYLCANAAVAHVRLDDE